MSPKKRAAPPPVLPDEMKSENLPPVEADEPTLAPLAQQNLGAGMQAFAEPEPADEPEDEDEDFEEVGGQGSAHLTRDALPVHPSVHEIDPTPWVNPTNLFAPAPREGMVQRWIRVATGDRADTSNASRKMREGWKPRKADTVPPGFSPPTINHGPLAGVIGVEGLILCEMPIEQNERRKLAMRQAIDKQTQAIDEQIMMVQQPGNPILRSAKTYVTHGTKRVPRVAE